MTYLTPAWNGILGQICNCSGVYRKDIGRDKWDKVFKNGQSKISGRQRLKNLKG